MEILCLIVGNPLTHVVDSSRSGINPLNGSDTLNNQMRRFDINREQLQQNEQFVNWLVITLKMTCLHRLAFNGVPIPFGPKQIYSTIMALVASETTFAQKAAGSLLASQNRLMLARVIH